MMRVYKYTYHNSLSNDFILYYVIQDSVRSTEKEILRLYTNNHNVDIYVPSTKEGVIGSFDMIVKNPSNTKDNPAGYFETTV